MRISYIGTKYHGWQRQPNVPSIQQTLEECISKMLGAKTVVVGCGRTDAGVHAKNYIAHFDFKNEKASENAKHLAMNADLDHKVNLSIEKSQGQIKKAAENAKHAPMEAELPLAGSLNRENNQDHQFDFDPVFRLNKMLPRDIAIQQMTPVSHDFHAQHKARSRTYEFHFHTYKDPLLAEQSTFVESNKLNMDHFEKALTLILNQQDFRFFCKSPDQYKHTICKIMRYSLEQMNEGVYKVTIQADRFLQSMIRLIIARSLDVAMGKMSPSELENHILKQLPFERKYMAFPQGLFLTNIEYEYFNI